MSEQSWTIYLSGAAAALAVAVTPAQVVRLPTYVIKGELTGAA